MRAIDVVMRVGPIDLMNIRRDNLLAWVVVLPFVIALLFRYGVPALAGWLLVEFGFDLTPYYPLIMSGLVVMTPSMVGMVVGFLLLDERDDQVFTALMVTPMPFGAYIAFRIVAPLAASLPVTLAAYYLAGLAPLPFGMLLVAVLIGSMTAPIAALFLAVVADNKVSGFAIVKVLNNINMLPTIAYFIDMPWQLAAGVVPGYWPLKLVWLIEAGQPIALYVLAGFVVNGAAIFVLLRTLNRNLRR